MKILVVDDDRRIVKTTCDILKIKGYEPVSALTGEEGVEKVRSDPPDCVLMDIKMPGINGLEAMTQMKKIVPDLPVVLVSAYATAEIVEEPKRPAPTPSSASRWTSRWSSHSWRCSTRRKAS